MTEPAELPPRCKWRSSQRPEERPGWRSRTSWSSEVADRPDRDRQLHGRDARQTVVASRHGACRRRADQIPALAINSLPNWPHSDAPTDEAADLPRRAEA